MDEVATSNEPIEADIPIGELRKQPFSLPAGFQWDTLKIDDPIVVSIIWNLYD